MLKRLSRSYIGKTGVRVLNSKKIHIRIQELYELSLKELPQLKIDKQLFLYKVFKLGEPAYTTHTMKDLGYFNLENGEDITTMSKHEFIARYEKTEEEEDEVTFDLSHSGRFVSHIHHPYPYSLKSVFDKVEPYYKPDRSTVYSILRYPRFALIKHVPTMMSSKEPLRRDMTFDTDTLTVVYSKSIVYCHTTHTQIVSKDRTVHEDVVKLWEKLLDTNRSPDEDVYKYIFALPDGSVTYQQVFLALSNVDAKLDVVSPISNKLDTGDTTLETTQYLESTISGCKVLVADVILKASRAYTDTKYPYCLVKDDTVLTIYVVPTHKQQNSFTGEKAKGIAEMVLGWANKIVTLSSRVRAINTARNISELRSKDPVLFNQEFCRCVPPRSQPIWVDERDVDDELAKGKIVIYIRGNYYTTKDRHMSNGMDYMGFINTTASQPAGSLPIIRTYKTNHLGPTKNYRHIKTWALKDQRKCVGGMVGQLDKEKVLLPLHLQYLYGWSIINPNPETKEVKTKKTTITRAEKVTEGELPDYIKTLLQDEKAYRKVAAKDIARGNKLLACCQVTEDQYKQILDISLKLVNGDADSIYDLSGKTAEDVELDITTHNIDHRVYGKVIESVTGAGIVVFTRDGIIPYRYSNITADKLVLLYLLPNGNYDLIVSNKDTIHSADLREELKHRHNTPVHVPQPKSMATIRKVDYTEVCIGLVCRLASWLQEAEVNVKYHLVPESQCRELCDSVYSCCIPEEMHFKLSEKDATPECAGTCIFNRGKAMLVLSSELMLSKLYKSFIVGKKEVNGDVYIYIKSPVDLTGRSLWKYTMEQILYPTINAYTTDARTEIVRCLDEEL